MAKNRRQDFIHHHRWREKIATDTFTPSPAPVVYNISGPMGERYLYTTGAEAENSAVEFSKDSVPPLYKNRSSKNGVHVELPRMGGHLRLFSDISFVKDLQKWEAMALRIMGMTGFRTTSHERQRGRNI